MTWKAQPSEGHGRRSIRVVVGLVLALGAMMGLVGCTTSGVCPAVWWGSTVEVQLSGSINAVDLVRLCVDEKCTSGLPTVTDDLPRAIDSVELSEFATPSPAPSEDLYGIDGFAERVDSDTWSVDVIMVATGQVMVQALSADGELLAEAVTELEFVRVGGTEECGGPMRAGVELTIPA